MLVAYSQPQSLSPHGLCSPTPNSSSHPMAAPHQLASSAAPHLTPCPHGLCSLLPSCPVPGPLPPVNNRGHGEKRWRCRTRAWEKQQQRWREHETAAKVGTWWLSQAIAVAHHGAAKTEEGVLGDFGRQRRPGPTAVHGESSGAGHEGPILRVVFVLIMREG
jgi:hypothetical protein